MARQSDFDLYEHESKFFKTLLGSKEFREFVIDQGSYEATQKMGGLEIDLVITTKDKKKTTMKP